MLHQGCAWVRHTMHGVLFLEKGNYIPEFQKGEVSTPPFGSEKGNRDSLSLYLFLSCPFPERVHRVHKILCKVTKHDLE